MEFASKTRLKARLTILLLAVVIAVACTLDFAVAIDLTTGGVAIKDVLAFGAGMLFLADRWLLLVARRAFSAAVALRHIVLDGRPLQIRHVSPSFPGRWLALLYARLHPELTQRGPL